MRRPLVMRWSPVLCSDRVLAVSGCLVQLSVTVSSCKCGEMLVRNVTSRVLECSLPAPSISANVCMNYKLNIKHKQSDHQRQYWVKLRHVQSPRWVSRGRASSDCWLFAVFQFVWSCSAWQWAWAQARRTRRTPWLDWRRTSPAPRVGQPDSLIGQPDCSTLIGQHPSRLEAPKAPY